MRRARAQHGRHLGGMRQDRSAPWCSTTARPLLGSDPTRPAACHRRSSSPSGSLKVIRRGSTSTGRIPPWTSRDWNLDPEGGTADRRFHDFGCRPAGRIHLTSAGARRRLSPRCSHVGRILPTAVVFDAVEGAPLVLGKRHDDLPHVHHRAQGSRRAIGCSQLPYPVPAGLYRETSHRGAA